MLRGGTNVQVEAHVEFSVIGHPRRDVCDCSYTLGLRFNDGLLDRPVNPYVPLHAIVSDDAGLNGTEIVNETSVRPGDPDAEITSADRPKKRDDHVERAVIEFVVPRGCAEDTGCFGQGQGVHD